MKKVLILALFIVGCAPTTATFYIGMPVEEFKNNNPKLNLDDIDGDDSDPLYIDWMDDNFGLRTFKEYAFEFENDTLIAVYHGVWNAFIQKEIDYSKYPNSKPEWFAD